MSTQHSHSLSISGAGSRESDISGLSLDEIFQLLSNSRRRAALLALNDADGPVEFKAVQKAVAEAEYNTDWESLEQGKRHTVYVSLHQTHLPALMDHDVVEAVNDRPTGLLKLGPAAEEVLEHLPGEKCGRLESMMQALVSR